MSRRLLGGTRLPFPIYLILQAPNHPRTHTPTPTQPLEQPFSRKSLASSRLDSSAGGGRQNEGESSVLSLCRAVVRLTSNVNVCMRSPRKRNSGSSSRSCWRIENGLLEENRSILKPLQLRIHLVASVEGRDST